jgi:hypothetical protein
MKSSYEKDLQYGFLLILHSTKTGRYRNGRFICNVKIDCVMDGYSYLKIHKCRYCKRYYILHNKHEVYFEPLLKKRLPSSVAFAACKYCISSAGHDSPLEEYPVHMARIRSRINMYF